MNRMTKLISTFLLAVFMGTAMIPAASVAGVQGRKNTAIGVSAATLYELFRGHTGTGLVLGAGSAYAWKRYNDERKHHHRYYGSYGRGHSHRYYYYDKYGHKHYYYR